MLRIPRVRFEIEHHYASDGKPFQSAAKRSKSDIVIFISGPQTLSNCTMIELRFTNAKCLNISSYMHRALHLVNEIQKECKKHTHSIIGADDAGIYWMPNINQIEEKRRQKAAKSIKQMYTITPSSSQLDMGAFRSHVMRLFRCWRDMILYIYRNMTKQ